MIFKLFKKRSQSKLPVETTVTPCKKHIQSPEEPITTKVTLPTESKAVQAAKRFVETFNSHDAESIAKTMSPTCSIEFIEAKMSCDSFMEENRMVLKCFPDINFAYKSVKDIAPNVAFIDKLCVTATHTGAPYGFGPYPAIEPKGYKIKNDPEDTTITIDPETGLITRMKIVAHGRLSGPPGFYEQIGGILF